MLIPLFDAHLDLAYNALGYDRDLTRSLADLRRRETLLRPSNCLDTSAPAWQEGWGTAAVSLPAMRSADIRICLGTLLARTSETQALSQVPQRFELDSASPAITEAIAMGQLAYYDRLEKQGYIRLIRDRANLDAVWNQPDGPLGCILSMEGCDPIVEPADVPKWWQLGLRTACLAHYGQGRYACGTGGNGPLTNTGKGLLYEFQKIGMILDLVHTAEQAFFQSLDQFDGPVFVSHANCRSLVPHDRQLSDEQIQNIVRRDGIIGVALDAWMLLPGYDRHTTHRDAVTLQHLADHIDHICQLAGNSRCVGIGSDLDGGFGIEQCPYEIDSICDIQLLGDVLTRRGYSSDHINLIFHGNWLTFFRKNLPYN